MERGKIAEFAEAMLCDDPSYRGPDAIIPPTFLTTAGRWAPAGVRVDVGFDRKRLLHGEQEYIFHGDLPAAGDVLTAQERVVDRYSKPGKRGGTMHFATVVTEYRDAGERSSLRPRPPSSRRPRESPMTGVEHAGGGHRFDCRHAGAGP